MAFNDPDYIRVVANFSITAADKPGWVISEHGKPLKGIE
jgi:hypothetical protein